MLIIQLKRRRVNKDTKDKVRIWANVDRTWVKMDFTSFQGYIVYRETCSYPLKFISAQL